MAGALDGYRIVDVTAMMTGPAATMMLGDQGADVIKVEPIDGGDLTRQGGSAKQGISPFFATVNRNKRSLAVDLKTEAGLEVVKRLVRTADVFIQNFRPGVAERMGIGEPALRELRSDLVYVSISGFGESGPYAHKRVYDPVIQALSGLAYIQGDRETGRPRMVRSIIPDPLTAVTAAQAVTAALLARERTGEGQHVRLSMLDSMVTFLWPEAMERYTFVNHDEEPGEKRLGQLRDLIFETSDGYITAGANSDKEWHALALAVGRPEWLEDERFATMTSRLKNWDVRMEAMQEAFRGRTSAELLELLDKADVPCAPINSRVDLLRDPQIVANELIVEVEHPVVGPVRQTRPAARFEGTPSSLRQPAPMLGEQTDEILSELGYVADEIATLRQGSTVA